MAAEFIGDASSGSELAGPVDADRSLDRRRAVDAAKDGAAHVAPAGDEGGEASSLAARDEQVDLVGTGHDGDPRVELALVPDRQVAVVDPAVPVLEGERAEAVAGVHPEIVPDVRPPPAVGGDGARMLDAQHHRAVA